MDRLDSFIQTEVLSKNTLSKLVHLLGTIDGEQAVVSVSRTQPLESLNIDSTHLLEKNGIYSWGLATWKHTLPKDPSVKIDVIWPATETHIAKYREQPVRLFTETPALYASVVKPYIETMRGDRIQWVRNILHNGAEADQVIYKDEDCLVLPNQRWDRQTMSTLYLMVLFYDDELASIRNLTLAHKPLLEKIKSAVYKVCAEKYSVPAHDLKLYFHYHPSYYQMHIHVAHVGLQQMDFGRSILVDNVIDMLEARPKGLETATLSYIMGTGHKLAKLLIEEEESR